MPLMLLSPGAFGDALSVPSKDSAPLVQKAAGSRPALDEGAETGPPPVARQRAETAFETIGLILVIAIILAAVWILIRKWV